MIDANKIVPDGFILLQTQNGTPKYAACMTGRLAGWLMKKYPDGNWVSERKLTNLEVMQAEDQRDDGIVHETPAATIQEPVMVAEPVAWYADTTYNANEDKQGDWPVELRDHRAISLGAKRPNAKWNWKPLFDSATLAAPMVADPTGVAVQLEGWRGLSKRLIATIEELELAATVKAVPSEALTAIHGLIAVAGAAYHLMDNTEESGPVGASVFKHQEDDNAYLTEALDQLDALPDNQPGYVMGPCAKAEWALRHILADKTSGGE